MNRLSRGSEIFILKIKFHFWDCIPGDTREARFDFQPHSSRELKLKRGERVTILIIDSSGWVKAVNEQKQEGWIPQCFVSPFDVQKDQDIKISAEVRRGSL